MVAFVKAKTCCTKLIIKIELWAMICVLFSLPV